MATHSINLAWGIPWTEEPDKLQPIGDKESDMTKQTTLLFNEILLKHRKNELIYKTETNSQT